MLRQSLLGTLSCLLWVSAAIADVSLYVSVLPLKYLAKEIGGEHVQVEAMVRPGHSPVTYEPTPRQMTSLGSANAYFSVGVPFETFWLDKIQQTNPLLEVIDVRERIGLVTNHAATVGTESLSGDHDSHNHQGMDPHIWLDPGLAVEIAKAIRDYLIRVDVENRAAYQENADQLITRLKELDRAISEILEPVDNRKFMVFHPAWGYFAGAYGFEQIAVETEGKEPGPRSLAALVELARREGIKTVFSEKQSGSKVVNALAAQIGASVVELDPLAEDYFENLIDVANSLARTN